MTTINTIQDLLELLRSQPEWAKELRAILLTDELLDLPSIVAVMAQTMNDMNRRLGHLEEDVSTLKGDVNTLKGNADDLKTRVTSIEGKVGRTSGREYERAAEPKAVSRTHQLLGFADPRVALGPVSGISPQLSSAISRARTNAARDGKPLPDINDSNDFHNADIIIADGAGRGNATRYALFEVALTLDDTDISRARDRAATLATLLTASVTPVVITDTASEEQHQRARDSQVTVITIPDS